MNWKLLWDIFVLFSRVALFSWGGGPVSMGLMQRETVKAGWMTPEQFADAVALGNALPGPISPQVAAYVGYKLSGPSGAIAATAASVLPTTLLMLVMMTLFFSVKDSPQVAAMLKAMRPVMIGLLVWTSYTMIVSVFGLQKAGWLMGFARNWDGIVIAVLAFLLLTFTEINPVFLMLAAAAFGFLVYR